MFSSMTPVPSLTYSAAAELVTYEEPDTEGVELEQCVSYDGSTARRQADITSRHVCSVNTLSKTRLCVTDTHIIALRLWCKSKRTH